MATQNNDQSYSGGKYPDVTLPFKDRNTPTFGLKYAQMITKDWSGVENSVLKNRREAMKKNKQYRHATQPGSIYLDNLGLDAGSQNAMSFQNIGIIPRIVNEIVGNMTERKTRLKARGIDPISSDQRKDFRELAIKRMKEAYLLEKIKRQSNLKMEVPVAPFEDVDDLDIYMDMTYTQAAETAAQLGVEFVMQDNDVNDLKARLIDDIVTYGKAGTRIEMIAGHGIKINPVDPENLLHGYSDSNSVSKAVQHIGEFKTYTVSEVMKMKGRNCNIEKEEDWMDVIRKVASKQNNPDYHGNNGRYSTISEEIKNRDDFRVTILHFEVKTSGLQNFSAFEKPDGLMAFHNKKDTWDPEEGTPAGQFDYDHHFVGTYIVGTNYILDWGPKSDVIRPWSNFSNEFFSYSVYMTESHDNVNNSLVHRMIPHVDQMQLAIMTMQRIMTKTPPVEFVVNVPALQGVILDTKSDTPADPTELVKTFMREGILYTNMKDAAGNPMPGQALDLRSSDLSSKLRGPVETFMFHKNQLLDIIGRPEFQPSSEMPVGTQKMQQSAYNKATSFVQRALVSIMKETAYKAFVMLQDLSIFEPETIERMIGRGAQITLDSTAGLTLRDMAIFWEMESDDFDRMRFEQNIQTALDRKLIKPSHATTAREIMDPKLGQRYLNQAEKKVANETAAMAQQAQMGEVQKQQQLFQIEIQKEQTLSQIRIKEKYEAENFEYMKLSKLQRENHSQEMQRLGLKDSSSKMEKQEDYGKKLNIKMMEEGGKDRRLERKKELEVEAAREKKMS